jgi:hypothetical protein
VTEYADVPPGVVAKLRAICLTLPDAYEEEAWAGTRWLVRKRTFAHVLAVEGRSDSAHTRAAKGDADDTAGPTTLVTFRSAGEELAMLREAGHPYFYAGWGRDVVGVVLEGEIDWDEVAELMTESYCVLAPKKLVALVDRPE